MKKIQGSQYTWKKDAAKDFDMQLREHNENEIRELLMGRKVIAVEDDHIELDNGTILKFEGNDGGCSCNAGDYDLTDLNHVDNIITNVEFVRRAKDDSTDKWKPEEIYEIFVLAEHKQLLAAFEGTDGNGYYGTGYWIMVRNPS